MEGSGSPDDGSGVGRCVCGLLSTEVNEDDKNNLQIECDICRIWYHAPCIGLGPVAVLAVDKLHCPRCESMCGPSILRSVTNSHRYDRTDPNADKLPKQVGTKAFIEELKLRIIPYVTEDVVAVVDSGDQLTLPFLNQMGFNKPILVSESDGLGMSIPEKTFNIAQVPAEVADEDMKVDCIEVYSQEARQMRLHDFCDAFKIPKEERTSPINCLSLEVSDSPLGEKVQPPLVARKLCWVNNVWPPTSQWDGGDPPRVQKYCIMSMEDAFTDFHIDFGGTSVWYHIFKGEKVFYLIQPTPTNLSLYERWQRLSTHSETFLGDMVDKCHKFVVREGETVLIPTGWIHAVFTPIDSLVFGGNFLHSLNIQLQLRVFDIEERIRTPKKFRFPSFEVVHWLAAQKLKSDLSDLNSDSTLCPAHLLSGIKSLMTTLKAWLPDITNRPCPMIVDPVRLVKDLNKEVRMAERIQMGCNPPKPERESKRKKQKKALNEDFIDISHKNAIAQLMTIKSPPKKRKLALPPVDEDVKSIKKASPSKSPLEKKKKLIKEEIIKKEEEEEEEKPSPIKLKLPKKPIKTDFDLTDRDSVRQLLSHRNNKLVEQPLKKKNTMKELNSELSDALAGFSDLDEKDEDLVIDEDPSKKPIKLKLKMFGKQKNVSKEQRRPPSRSHGDEKMTKVHQDDDYIYPSLDMSDDEMNVGQINNSKDEAWCPKAKVRPSAGHMRSERPHREKIKNKAVEMGLKMAAERRKKSKLLHVSSPTKSSPVNHKSQKLSGGSVLEPGFLSNNSKPKTGTSSSSSSAAPITSSVQKRKGATAKQRLGKILKLKF